MPSLDPFIVRSIALFAALVVLGVIALCFFDFSNLAIGAAIQTTMLLFWCQEALLFLARQHAAGEDRPDENDQR